MTWMGLIGLDRRTQQFSCFVSCGRIVSRIHFWSRGELRTLLYNNGRKYKDRWGHPYQRSLLGSARPVRSGRPRTVPVKSGGTDGKKG